MAITAKLSLKTIIAVVIGVMLFVFMMFLPAPPELAAYAAEVDHSGAEAMRLIGVTLFTICLWVSELFPDWLTAILMMLMWVVINKMTFAQAFVAFSSSSTWLLVGAFCLSAAVTKTGLFKRIAWFLVKLFKPEFKSLSLALLVAGVVCTPLVPSATAKAIIGIGIAKSIADAMGYEDHSIARNGLFAAAYIGFCCMTPSFLSSSFLTYTALGTMPEEYSSKVTWGSWFVSMIPWTLTVVILSYFAIRFMCKANTKGKMTEEYLKEQYASLGPVSGKEKLSMCLLAGAVLLWLLENIIGIEAAVTAMLVAFLAFATGILEKKEIGTAVPWGLVIFVGCVLNLGNTFAKFGIDKWLSSILTPFFAQIGSPALMILIVAVVVILLRFLMVSLSATIVLVMATLSPVVQSMGISPYIMGLVVLAAEQVWFVSYQNVVYTPAMTAMGGTIVHPEPVKYCLIFHIISIIGFMVCLPYWKLLGLM